MSQFAVIKTGGKQYLVKQGDIIKIEKLDGKPGKKISFKDVLLVFDKKGKTQVGRPKLKISIDAEILEQGRGKKIKVIKYKPKTRYHKKTGHRQYYTKVKITKIAPEKKTRAAKNKDQNS